MDATRYKKYSAESGIDIGSMAVIVQEMVHAEYAGVAFTTNPIEGDDRIALIEVVEGVGESLVSSQKTPATLRVNKMTDIARIQQIGDDNIEEVVLTRICDLLMPYMHEIEKLYDQPMDVEWAVKNGDVFILQARPITTI
ncbi:phosphoenolpyruvate synthase [compost metagenome]